jgi:N-acetylglucosaminyldiphosphoundecaprenol N-acetyl-beta-D-mannosaminyltransferase
MARFSFPDIKQISAWRCGSGKCIVVKWGNGLTASGVQDDFARRVYCVLGVPVDAITMDGLVDRIFQAATLHSPLFISTPNLNYLMLSQRDPAFRRSLLESDICPADGVGVLLICRLLGIPITSRVSGSDLPAALRAIQTSAGDVLRIALLGGEPGVGERACQAINAGDTERLLCVAAIDPGRMTAEKMSDPSIVERVNATKADFLLVALGAQKGQAWLLANRQKLTVPVVSHLGATLNFLAGAVNRAPEGIRKLGLEWLWRIKEEPKLTPRYVSDGLRLAWILLTRILPLRLWLRWPRADDATLGSGVWLDTDNSEYCRVTIAGVVGDGQLSPVVEAFRSAAHSGRDIRLDFQPLKSFGMGFAGEVLMLEKATQKQSKKLTIVGAAPSVARALDWCGLGHLKSEGGMPFV